MGWACSVMNQGEGRWLCPAPAGACWASHLAPVSVNYCNPTWGCQVDEFPCTGFCVGRKTGGGRRGLEADASLSSKVTKRMGPPSSPSPKRTALCFVAADLLFALKRRKHRKTCVGDQKNSSSNPHFDYLKQKSSQKFSTGWVETQPGLPQLSCHPTPRLWDGKGTAPNGLSPIFALHVHNS